MGYETLGFAVDADIAQITFRRPKRLNAFNTAMSQELCDVAGRLADGDAAEARVVVVRGEGEHFMAGADIGMLQEWAELSAEELHKTLAAGFSPSMLEQLPQPVIAAVDGFALGMGFEVALACDLRIATQRAQFGLPEIGLGVMPGAGGSQRLPRLAGRTRAAEVVLTGEHVDATTVAGWGVVNRVVDPEGLDDEVAQWTSDLRAKSPLALQRAKASLLASDDETLSDGIATELDHFVASVGTEDAKEGTAAFLEKRLPNFVGR